MDYLQHGIGLRGLAQMDPLVAYKNEAYELFQDLMNSIWADFARLIYHVEVTIHDANGQPMAPQQPPRRSGSSSSSSATGGGRVTYSGGNSAAGAMAMAAAAGGEQAARSLRRGGAAEPVQQRRRRRGPADRAQRPVLVRLGQEVQEVPRRLSRRGSAPL